MLLSTHADRCRGHRVRELVCSYRTLRDGERQAAHLPAVPLSDPKVAAQTLAPLLAGEPVEVFAVACLSTKRRLLAWHVLSRGTRQSTPVSLSDVFVPASLIRHVARSPDRWRRRPLLQLPRAGIVGQQKRDGNHA